MSRSLRVAPDYINKVKQAVKLNRYHSQKDLADDCLCSRTTVSKFLNGKAVDFQYFEEFCLRLGLNLEELAMFEEDSSEIPLPDRENNEILEEDTVYIDRPPIESQCYRELERSGCLIRIKAPTLMGKTKLIQKLIDFSQSKNNSIIYINLNSVEEQDFESFEKFLKWFCKIITKKLNLINKIDEFWDCQFNNKLNCTMYFNDYLFSEVQKKVLICLDDVDRIFPYEKISKDFFSMLRAWHDDSRIDSTWQKLRLVISHATECYIKMDVHQSPFNVGLPINLSDFNFEQIQSLVKYHKIDLTSEQVSQLHDEIGGHPYLLEQALLQLKYESLETILQNAATRSGIYKDHLKRIWLALQKHPQLVLDFQEIISSETPINLELMTTYKLNSMGLINYQGNSVFPRYPLYKKYFAEHL